MRNQLAFVAALTLFSMATPALALEGAELAKEKGCFSCHDVKGEEYGPPFRDVARRFAGISTARQTLSRAIQAGTNAASAGKHWGNKKMPKDTERADRSPVSQAEAEQLVDWILSLKK